MYAALPVIFDKLRGTKYILNKLYTKNTIGAIIWLRTFRVGVVTTGLLEVYQTLFSMGAYTASDNTLH